jgi:hypothetical protein
VAFTPADGISAGSIHFAFNRHISTIYEERIATFWRLL